MSRPRPKPRWSKPCNATPDHGPARYYWGQMLAQTGRPDLAYSLWVNTLQHAPAGAPWADAIRAQIDDLAFRAGAFNAPDIPPAEMPPVPARTTWRPPRN